MFLITNVACQEEKPHVCPETSHTSEGSSQTDPQSLFIMLKLWHALITAEPKAMLSSGYMIKLPEVLHLCDRFHLCSHWYLLLGYLYFRL